jgi:hypothetical protein
MILFLKKQLRNCKSGDYYSILSIKNGHDNVPIEDNCLEEERSDDSKYCLKSVHCH